MYFRLASYIPGLSHVFLPKMYNCWPNVHVHVPVSGALSTSCLMDIHPDMLHFSIMP